MGQWKFASVSPEAVMFQDGLNILRSDLRIRLLALSKLPSTLSIQRPLKVEP